MNMPNTAVMNNATSTIVKQLVHDWVSWLYTRRFYAAPVPENILVRMMEEHAFKSGEPPNANNSALCNAFNKVLKQAHDVEPEYLIPFMYVYLKEYRPRKVDALAIDMGINRDTVYDRAHKAAIRYYRKALINMRDEQDKLCREVAEVV